MVRDVRALIPHELQEDVLFLTDDPDEVEDVDVKADKKRKGQSTRTEAHGCRLSARFYVLGKKLLHVPRCDTPTTSQECYNPVSAAPKLRLFRIHRSFGVEKGVWFMIMRWLLRGAKKQAAKLSRACKV